MVIDKEIARVGDPIDYMGKLPLCNIGIR